ncbi:MAG: NDP-sugar synthase [Thaumarchaeota archaeon]|nr:NDP-sugar synthase [Nitrososphaerota archaeon]
MSPPSSRKRQGDDCKVVILAGGEGTRLRPLTLTRPKAMMPLGSKPVIEHIISETAKSGFTDFIVTVNYEKEQVMRYIGRGTKLGVKVDYAIEPEGIYLGTAGSVKLASHLLDGTFIVTQGDAFTTIDLRRALEFHRQTQADATIILKQVPDPWLYGTVILGSDMRITAFQEKPPRGQEKSNLVSTGIYILEPEVLDFTTPIECDFAKDVFPHLVNEGKRLFGFVGEGFWVDIGSLNGYLEGTRKVLETHLKEGQKNSEAVLIGQKVIIDDSVILDGPVLIEDRVSVGKGSQIGPYAVIKAGSKIGSNTVIENSAIFERVKLGSNCQIRKSVIGERATISHQTIIDGSIIGPGSRLERLVQVKNGGRVWPSITVHDNTLVEGTLALPTDRPFLLHSGVGQYTGFTANTIEELAGLLNRVEVKSIEYHLYRRDFERWVRETFQANLLARQISDLRKQGLRGRRLRRELQGTIKEWLNYSTEFDNQRLKITATTSP